MVIRVFDLSANLSSDTRVYPGDPGFGMEVYSSLEKDGYLLHRVCLGEHLGTHLDAPIHFGGEWDLSSVPDERLVAPAVLVDISDVDEIVDVDVLRERAGGLPLGGWLLIRFGESRGVLDGMVARALLDSGVVGVGVDRDSPDREPYPFHRVFLGGNGLILENLVLDHVPLEARGCRILVVGVPGVVGGSGFPARVFLLEFEGAWRCPLVSTSVRMGGL